MFDQHYSSFHVLKKKLDLFRFTFFMDYKTKKKLGSDLAQICTVNSNFGIITSLRDLEALDKKIFTSQYTIQYLQC